MMQKDRYILSVADREDLKYDLNILFSKEEIDNLDLLGQKRNLSSSAFSKVFAREKLIEIEYNKFKEEYENVIDIYDLAINSKEYIYKNVIYLVLNPNGNHFTINPI